MFSTVRFFLLTLLIVSLLPGCGSSGGGSGAGDTSEATFVARSSDCGVVVDQQLFNPPDARAGIPGRIIDGLDGEFVAFEPDHPEMGPILVKSLAARKTDRTGAKRFIASILTHSPTAVLFEAGDGCYASREDGGTGVIGTIILSNGRVLTELLLTRGFLRADSSTRHCSAGLVENCYAALAETAPTPTPIPTVTAAPSVTNPPTGQPAPADDSSSQVSGTAISYFLWKPQSERDGTLAILFNPTASRVTVNGISLQSSGPSNGRASTFRASTSGCSFGRATIKAWDTRGRLLAWPGSRASYTISNGCNRVEF